MANLKICLVLQIFGCLLTLGAAGGDDMDLLQHMEHLQTRRNPFISRGNQVIDLRPEARKYIEEEFEEYGLDVHLQAFNSTGDSEVSGVNVIGISKVSEDGKVLVVGADYDTGEEADPLANNGGGVAVMLEAARLYMENSEEDEMFERVGTIIFVAFDVSSKKYTYFKGKPGSKYFVDNWLWSYLQKDASRFEGAIIIDSITNSNSANMSQTISGDFNKVFPEAYDQISADGRKGNFLGIVSQADQDSQDLISKFSGNYNKDRKGRQFRVQEMQMSATPPLDFVMNMLGHQSHLNFWTLEDETGQHPLPAVLLTDTEIYRSASAGSTACKPSCQAQNFLTRERKQFISKTTKALVGTLYDLRAKRRANTDNSGCFNTPSSMLMLALLMLIKLFRW